MQLAVLNDDSFVAKFDRDQLTQLDDSRFCLVLQVRGDGLVREFIARSSGQEFGEIFDLAVGQSHAAVRSKRADLRQRLAAMNQRRRADRNFYGAERILFASRFDYFAGRHIHRVHPGPAVGGG